MPRPRSTEPHPISELRAIIEMTQEQFSELCGIKLNTLRSIETWRLPLSLDIAQRIEASTGILVLNSKDSDQPKIVIKTWSGDKYSKDYFLSFRNSIKQVGDLLVTYRRLANITIFAAITSGKTTGLREMMINGLQTVVDAMDLNTDILKNVSVRNDFEEEVNPVIGHRIMTIKLLAEVFTDAKLHQNKENGNKRLSH